jgi:hypothetical protein
MAVGRGQSSDDEHNVFADNMSAASGGNTLPAAPITCSRGPKVIDCEWMGDWLRFARGSFKKSKSELEKSHIFDQQLLVKNCCEDGSCWAEHVYTQCRAGPMPGT